MSYWSQNLVLVIFSIDGRVLCAHSAHAQTGTALSRLQFPIVPFKKIAQAGHTSVAFSAVNLCSVRETSDPVSEDGQSLFTAENTWKSSNHFVASMSRCHCGCRSICFVKSRTSTLETRGWSWSHTSVRDETCQSNSLHTICNNKKTSLPDERSQSRASLFMKPTLA